MNDNVEKLQQLYAAFGRGEIAPILENVTEDVEWGVDTIVSEVPWYGMRRGPEGVAQFFESLARDVDFRKFEPTAFMTSGDEVVVTVDYDYRLRRNGKGTTSGAMHRFRIRDGKVASFRAYEDTAAIREAWLS